MKLTDTYGVQGIRGTTLPPSDAPGVQPQVEPSSVTAATPDGCPACEFEDGEPRCTRREGCVVWGDPPAAVPQVEPVDLDAVFNVAMYGDRGNPEGFRASLRKALGEQP